MHMQIAYITPSTYLIKGFKIQWVATTYKKEEEAIDSPVQPFICN